MCTDPPYGVEYDASWRSKTKNRLGPTASGKVKNDDKTNWELAFSFFPGKIAYVWHSLKMKFDSLESCDFELICDLIWVKPHFALSRGDYHWKHESCWYAARNGSSHNWQGARDQSTVWEIASLGDNYHAKSDGDERTAHSTQKPLECMARPIRNNSSKGDGVYDPFCGSGTTLLAAEQLNRKCFAIELDPAYCDIIVDRWVKYRKKCGKDATIVLNNQQIEWS
jgi:DNA modification methylase